MDEAYGKISLGRPAVFYLPLDKLNKTLNGDFQRRLESFLLENYGGFTKKEGNVSGAWNGGSMIHYDNSIEYKVAFVGKEKIPRLEVELAKMAEELGEEAIYLETGEDSWLIKPPTQKA